MNMVNGLWHMQDPNLGSLCWTWRSKEYICRLSPYWSDGGFWRFFIGWTFLIFSPENLALPNFLFLMMAGLPLSKTTSPTFFSFLSRSSLRVNLSKFSTIITLSLSRVLSWLTFLRLTTLLPDRWLDRGGLFPSFETETETYNASRVYLEVVCSAMDN